MLRVTDNSMLLTVVSLINIAVLPTSRSFHQDRYDQLSTVLRFWRHLMMLKRAGRGHDPEGIDSTAAGELAVDCPACPHPGKNLPPDWDKASTSVL